MKKLLILVYLVFSLSLNLYANEFAFSGKFQGSYSSVKKETPYRKPPKDLKGMINTNLQLSTDYNGDNFNFQSSVYMYHTKIIGNAPRVNNQNYIEGFKNDDIIFRSLYLSYKITENLSLGLGIVPFSHSSTTEFNSDYTQDGEGIYMLNDSVLTAMFGVYKTQNSKTTFGIGTFDDLILPTGLYINEGVSDGGSFTYFIINKLEYNKWKIMNEFLSSHLVYEKKSLADAFNIGTSVIYDDSENSGLSLYGVIGMSVYANHNKDAKEAIYKNTLGPKAPYGDFIKSAHPNNFAFDNKTYYGEATLLGFRKDFSLFREDFFINAEWFHTFNDWISGNQGNMYFPKNTQMSNVRNDSYFLNLGYNINNFNTIRMSYSILEFNEEGKIGNPSATLPSEDYIGVSIKKASIFRVVYDFKF